MRENEKLRIVFASKRYSLFAKHIEADGYVVKCLHRYDGLVANVFNEMIHKITSKSIKKCYNQELKGYDGTYIVFDMRMHLEDLIWLKEENPAARIVFCYWNPITTSKLDIEKVKRTGCEIWSYGEKECEKYQIKQTLSFYCNSMYKQALTLDADRRYDIIFAGKDKGRLAKIYEMIKRNHWEELNWKLYITPDHFWQRYKKREYQKGISYERLQIMQSEAKAILELVPTESVDITMRAIDAMVLKRKLITDNKMIIKKEYYNPGNIFILGVDDPQRITEFLESEYEPVSDKIIEKYQLSAWVEQILEDNPINVKGTR